MTLKRTTPTSALIKFQQAFRDTYVTPGLSLCAYTDATLSAATRANRRVIGSRKLGKEWSTEIVQPLTNDQVRITFHASLCFIDGKMALVVV